MNHVIITSFYGYNFGFVLEMLLGFIIELADEDNWIFVCVEQVYGIAEELLLSFMHPLLFNFKIKKKMI